MKQTIARCAMTVAIAGALALSTVIKAHAATPAAFQTPYTIVVEPAKPPVPWIDFCKRHPSDDDCNPGVENARVVENNLDNWVKLYSVNSWVNTHVKPMTDWKMYHVADYWEYPKDGFGDCEKYALLKRRMLADLGFPPEALLMTVVWSGNEGHAILTIRTEQGDFVLDNLSSKILPWYKTPYDFVKRQSPSDLTKWVYIDGYRQQQPVVVASHKRHHKAKHFAKNKRRGILGVASLFTRGAVLAER